MMICPQCSSRNVSELDNLNSLWCCGDCSHIDYGESFDLKTVGLMAANFPATWHRDENGAIIVDYFPESDFTVIYPGRSRGTISAGDFIAGFDQMLEDLTDPDGWEEI